MPDIQVIAFASALLMAATPAGVASAAAERQGAPLQIPFVEKLVETSSAARQVESSGVAAAIERRRHARELLARAAVQNRSGDDGAVQDLLGQAVAAMFEAVSLAGSKERTAAKKMVDFDARLESVEALLAAYDRISLDKQSADREAVDGRIRDIVSRAGELRRLGEVDAARETLDAAYLEAKNAIEALRGGDTLVRSLSFATREEEYRYELDRNDTHNMLVTVLIRNKLEAEGVRAMVTPFLEHAARLREQAEDEAARGEFENAIKTLEASTGQLVRAIRGAGVFIPG